MQEAALEPLPPPQAAPPPGAVLSPSPLPAAGSGASYWVEYGAFVGKTSALRLKEALGRHGLAAFIVASHGRDGRKLPRVRSAALTDLCAHDAMDEARRGLRIVALPHRDRPAAAPQFRVWFGAFPEPGPAARLSRELAGGGIVATVSSLRGASGKILHVVQSRPVPDHAQALALGERGRQLGKTDFVIERSPPPPGAGHPAARPPPRRLADRR